MNTNLKDQISGIIVNEFNRKRIFNMNSALSDQDKAFLKAVDNDPRITGIQLYEVVWNARENNGIIKVDEMGNTSWVLPEDV